MNEAFKAIGRTIAIVLVSIALGAGITGYIIQSGADKQLAAMQATISELTANNQRLTADKESLAATVSRLTTESERQRELISKLTSSTGSIGQGLDSAEETVRRAYDRISELIIKAQRSGAIQ